MKTGTTKTEVMGGLPSLTVAEMRRVAGGRAHGHVVEVPVVPGTACACCGGSAQGAFVVGTDEWAYCGKPACKALVQSHASALSAALYRDCGGASRHAA